MVAEWEQVTSVTEGDDVLSTPKWESEDRR